MAVNDDFTTSEMAMVCCSTNKKVASMAPKNQKKASSCPSFKRGILGGTCHEANNQAWSPMTLRAAAKLARVQADFAVPRCQHRNPCFRAAAHDTKNIITSTKEVHRTTCTPRPSRGPKRFHVHVQYLVVTCAAGSQQKTSGNDSHQYKIAEPAKTATDVTGREYTA